MEKSLVEAEVEPMVYGVPLGAVRAECSQLAMTLATVGRKRDALVRSHRPDDIRLVAGYGRIIRRQLQRWHRMHRAIARCGHSEVY